LIQVKRSVLIGPGGAAPGSSLDLHQTQQAEPVL